MSPHNNNGMIHLPAVYMAGVLLVVQEKYLKYRGFTHLNFLYIVYYTIYNACCADVRCK